MPRPPINLGRKIKDILQHIGPLPTAADVPFLHYEWSATSTWNLLEYIEGHVSQRSVKPAVVLRHMNRLRGMILVNLIETFERFLKETAAGCVDCLGKCILDDRFDEFRVQGSSLAVHFGTDTLGKSLCESDIWLDCDEINRRFRRLLANPFLPGDFYLFPKSGQNPASERWRHEIMSILWQVRHTIVHNVGVITQSDAIKLRLLLREQVLAPRALLPTRDDLRYVKRFLDETATGINERVGLRLAELLETIHKDNPILFVPQEMANRLRQIFGKPLTVAGAVGQLPPP